MKPARVTSFRPADVKSVRETLKASQTELALMIGVSVATLRNWEQGRRTQDGPALALLRVATRNPRAVAEALHREPRSIVQSRGANDEYRMANKAGPSGAAKCMITRLDPKLPSASMPLPKPRSPLT